MAKGRKGKTVKMTTPESYIRQRARTLPVHKCYINQEWEETGLASVIVARSHTNGNFTVGLYLVDLRCLGVKDTQYFFNIYASEFKELLDFRKESANMIEVPYELVHNVVYAGIEFAEDFGFKPHNDFSVARHILEEDTDDIELMEINCGYDGRPFYVRGPLDSDMKASRILAQLEKTAGPGNYGFVDEMSEENWENEEKNDTSGENAYNENDWEEELWDDFLDDPFDMELGFDEKDIQKSCTLEFRIQIKNISRPPVWRIVSVPSYFSFFHFHHIIQATFGWADSHLYQFSEKGFESESVITSVYECSDMDDQQQTEAKDVLLSDVFKEEQQKYIYIYDFGDSWEHIITLEKIIPEVSRMPRLIDGKGACPPEDCGGTLGYQNLKDIMANKSHPEYNDVKKWLGLKRGEGWDPAAFDVEETKEMLEDPFSS